MNRDGFVGCVGEIEDDLEGFENNENQRQQKNIVDDAHGTPYSPKHRNSCPPLFFARRIAGLAAIFRSRGLAGRS
jgi:hypothetical protein